ncbi:hypothetical protein, partial [Bacillus sp. AFS073361]|uniref:hypothetical protein n=1 Tax=Bacillus sp. AFS073361 TaxID=2033511 RepID=UPI001C55573A
CYVGLVSYEKLKFIVCLHDFVCLVFKEQAHYSVRSNFITISFQRIVVNVFYQYFKRQQVVNLSLTTALI